MEVTVRWECEYDRFLERIGYGVTVRWECEYDQVDYHNIILTDSPDNYTPPFCKQHEYSSGVDVVEWPRTPN